MIIDGKAIASQIQSELATEVNKIQGRKPCLAVVLVGENAASQVYVSRKTKACQETGILSIKKTFPSTLSQADLLHEVETLNKDPNIDGILVQLPLPPQINASEITNAISPDKDVDGFHPINVGKLLLGETDGFQPCTPLGIKVLLDRYGIDVTGKHAVIVGRSNIVGKPMAAMLIQTAWGNATVTIVHSKSGNLEPYCKSADILIAAIGKPKFIKANMIKEGAVVIDVGINRINNQEVQGGSQLVGDVDFEGVKDKCSYITPVPGGVGPMTIAMLLSNTLKSYHKHLAKLI